MMRVAVGAKETQRSESDSARVHSLNSRRRFSALHPHGDSPSCASAPKLCGKRRPSLDDERPHDKTQPRQNKVAEDHLRSFSLLSAAFRRAVQYDGPVFCFALSVKRIRLCFHATFPTILPNANSSQDFEKIINLKVKTNKNIKAVCYLIAVSGSLLLLHRRRLWPFSRVVSILPAGSILQSCKSRFELFR